MAAVWDPSLSVGVASIDEQHKQLFASLDALVLGLRQNRASEECARMMTFLGDYVVQHFGAEEKLMRSRAYPDALAHAAQHARFLATLSALQLELASKGPSAALALKLATRVGDWLAQHIRRSDTALAAYLRAGDRPRAR